MHCIVQTRAGDVGIKRPDIDAEIEKALRTMLVGILEEDG